MLKVVGDGPVINKSFLYLIANPCGKGYVMTRYDGRSWKMFIDICFTSVESAKVFAKKHFNLDVTEWLEADFPLER